MKKKVLGLVIVLMSALLVNAQDVVFDFEQLSVPDTGFYIGADGNGGFGIDDLTFSNNFVDYGSFFYWDNFSYVYDTVSVDNQYIAVPGNANSGNIFGNAYVPADWTTYESVPVACSFANDVTVSSIMVTNNYSAYDVMVNGSSYTSSAPFATNDFFKLLIIGKIDGNITDTVVFYLADFTNGNSYIIDSWSEVDLTPLGVVDTILFTLESSDNGSYGMNTPAYFCIDDLKYSILTSLDGNDDIKFSVFPNPTTNYLNLSKNVDSYSIFDLNGKKILESNNYNGSSIDVSFLTSGIYLLNVISGENTKSIKFVKK